MTTTIEREQYLDLLTQPTRVQLGTLTTIGDHKVFKVEYELSEEYLTLEAVEELKEATGLTALFITLVQTTAIDTEDVDGTSDGYGGYDYTTVVTDITIETEVKYTYY